jgi:hypothetical protein
MKSGKREFLAGMAGWGLVAGLPRAWAQSPFPTKPIRIGGAERGGRRR